MTDQPLINILIRTSNREMGFRRLIRTIHNQTYKNVRIIVSYDTIDQPSYTKKYNLTVVNVHPIYVRFSIDGDGETKYTPLNEPAFYNRYCNVLMSLVEEGYFVIIDDDDYIYGTHALENIVPYLQEDKANIIQMKRNSHKKPEKGKIIAGLIGMPCFVIHNKHKNLSSFTGEYDADYQYIKEVSDKIGINFIPQILVKCSRRAFGVIKESKAVK